MRLQQRSTGAIIPCLLSTDSSSHSYYSSIMNGGTHHYSFLRPSTDVPWAVDAVSAVPESIVDTAPLACVSQGRWHCLATLQQDSSLASPTRSNSSSNKSQPVILSVWYSHPKDDLTEQKHKQNAVLQLHHEKLTVASENGSNTEASSFTATSSQDRPLLLSMVSASSKSVAATDSIYLYVVHPSTGLVLAWKLSATDFGKPFPPTCCASCRIPLEQADHANDATSNNDTSGEPEHVTALTVAWPPQFNHNDMPVAAPMILAGTSQGHVYWMTQCLAPMSLEVMPVNHSTPSTTKTGYLGSMLTLFSAATTATNRVSLASVVSILIVSPTRFLAYDVYAQRADWTVLRTDPRVTFQPTSNDDSKMDWVAALNNVGGNNNNNSHDTLMTAADDAIVGVQLQCACIMTKTASDVDDLVDNNNDSSRSTTTHMLLLTHHEHAFDATSSRLQWVVVDNDTTGMTILEHSVLDRFVDPSNVSCLMVPTAHGGCYAALQPTLQSQSSMATPKLSLPPPVTVFLCHYQGQIMELDLSVLQDQLVADYTEFVGRIWAVSGRDEGAAVCGGGGMYLLTSQGLGLLVRRILPAPTSPASKKSSTGYERANVGTPGHGPTSVNQLAVHLRSQFLQYYHHQATAAAVVPPSLKRASLSDLEAAVIQVATQQAENASANHLDAHHALMEFLQESGVYHRLSALARHVLLVLGQQIVAYRALKGSKRSSQWENEQLNDLISPKSLLMWLGRNQSRVLAAEEGSDRREAYMQWLCLALQEASLYNLDNRASKYDLLTHDRRYTVDSEDALPDWTVALPKLLTQLLGLLQTQHVAASTDTAQIVIPSALEAYKEYYNWVGTDTVKDQYANVQSVGVNLLRRLKVDDELVRDICVDYHYFGGLCEIAHGHETKADATIYTLDSYFETLASTCDLSTGLIFPMYALKWYSDRNLLGHVLKYGQKCPEVLSQLIMDEDKLKPYRWIHSTRIGDYNGATESLLSSASRQSSTLKDTKINLGHAKLLNSIVEKESTFHKDSAITRREVIEKKRELTNAQELLCNSANDENDRLLTPPQLLEVAKRSLETVTLSDDKVQICVTALAICASFDTPVASAKAASDIWSLAISADHLLWKDLITKEDNLSDPSVRTLIREETVFGGLVSSCSDTGKAWENVRFGQLIESEVFVKLDIQDPQMKLGLPRLLHNAAVVDP